MKRREFLASSALFLASPALAQSLGVADLIVRQLQEQGFTSIRVSRTWLGRVRIVATNDMYRREIILNPRTGEILRDFWEVLATGQPGGGLFEGRTASGGGSGKGGNDDDDDDEDDDDDNDDDEDDDEDDRSGSNSGKG